MSPSRQRTLIQPPQDDYQADHGRGDDPEWLPLRRRVFCRNVSLAVRTAGRVFEDLSTAVGTGHGRLISRVVAAVTIVIPVVAFTFVIVIAVWDHQANLRVSAALPNSLHLANAATARLPRCPIPLRVLNPCQPDSGSRSCSPSWLASPCCWPNRPAKNRSHRFHGEARSSPHRPHRDPRDRTEICDRGASEGIRA